MKIVIVCTLLVTLISYSNQQCLTVNDNIQNPRGHKVLYSGQQEFSLALLQAINEVGPTENIFFSPYSTFHAVLLAYFISGSKTESYLQRALRIDPSLSKSAVLGAYKFDRLATRLNTINSSYEFTNANRIYVAKQIGLRECLEPLFEDELQKTDFQSNPNLIRNEINQWVENNTHEMIKNLLPPGTIDASTNLVLVNAAYFKGVWVNKFDPEETKPEAFYVSPNKNPIMVDMMHLEATLNFDISETLKAHILELPYQGDDISMFILLPPFAQESQQADGGIETILKNLNAESFNNMINGSISPRLVQVSLPKFSLEHTIELAPVLNKIGVGDLFTDSSDLTGLAPQNDIKLGGALHTAKIEVSEEGTKAAAATVLFSFRSSRPAEPAQFNCNHPFVYVIFDKPNDSILFAGVFRRPS